ncbi:small VCP/p97-interacting protein isoform X3 [Hemibagrus wyckioides]|uniref:small VCP/p97-interacting protein isoform X3 n=1 Tax=Hemibagrus wyckioides TaxID=337641 RepID=UPI00266D4010|nr:small VCP/p97-interacting protein isoform X3 [Hemibagrus wyckioides]
MGMCLPCLGGAADDVVVTPDPETKRRQLAEAAEKRQKERISSGFTARRVAKAARARTEASRTRKPWKGKKKNKKRWKNRR